MAATTPPAPSVRTVDQRDRHEHGAHEPTGEIERRDVRHPAHLARLAEGERDRAQHDRRDPGGDERGGHHARALAELGVDRRLQRDQRTDTDGREHGEQAGHGAPFRGRDAYPPAAVTTIPETFPAFLATQRDDAVDRGPATLAAADLGEGEVTVRVRWSSINYKDALATIPKGQVARISPLVPGVDLAGEVVASDDPAVAVGSEVLVTGYDLGVAHHGGWAQYARVPAAWVVALPDGLSSRQAMALGTAGLTAGLSIHALEAHGLRPDDGPVLVLGASGGVGSTAVGALAAAGYEVVGRDGQGRPGRLPARHRRARDRHARGDDRRLRSPAGEDALGGDGRPRRRRRHRLRAAHDALRRRRRPQRPDRRHDAGHDGAARSSCAA